MPTDRTPVWRERHDKEIPTHHPVQREMFWGICTCRPLLQCPLYCHNDHQETKNHHAFSQTTGGEDDQKRYIVYKITCPRCSACYVGQSSRHLHTALENTLRIQDQQKLISVIVTPPSRKNILIFWHLRLGGRGICWYLFALYIQELEPKINTNATFTPRYEWVRCGPVWKRNLNLTTRDHSGGKTPHGDPRVS